MTASREDDRASVVANVVANIPINARKTPMNLQFCDIFYEIADDESSSKILLHQLSGEFRAGELSAIIGPSGSGKTTLLNILSGYRIRQISGHITVNGKKLQSKAFHELIRYISQVDHIDPYFTVWETLRHAAQFKLNRRYRSHMKRDTVIAEILEMFNLSAQADTICSQISDGERKRLSIAIELMDGPGILILDEPTTGLDEFSAAQCVRHLKEMTAKTGCTIISAIHSPSARILAMFDTIFTIAEGACIYQGTAQGIVPYLQQFGLNCPLNYNPADFLRKPSLVIEVATQVYGNYHNEMVQKTRKDHISKCTEEYVVAAQASEEEHLDSIELKPLEIKYTHDQCLESKSRENNTPWCLEFLCNLKHILHQLWRDKTNLYLRFFTDIILSGLIGISFENTGSNAVLGMRNFYFCLVTMAKCIFVSMTPMVAYVSLQRAYLRREHFNQWYRLNSYFMALLLSQIMISLVMTLPSSVILYFLSNQPGELHRFLLFSGIIFTTTLMGSSYGIFIGSMFNSVTALFMGPSFMSVWVVLSLYPMVPDTLSGVAYVLVRTCGLRYSLEGFMASLFLFERSDLLCPQDVMLCIFSKPRFILRITGCNDIDYVRAVAYLLAFYATFSVLAYWVIKCRLSRSNIMNCGHYRHGYYKLRNFCDLKLL